MANIFMYLAGKAVGYSYIRDLGVVVRLNDIVILTKEEAESSNDIVNAIDRGELDVVKAIPISQINKKDLDNYYVGSPIEIDGKTFVGKNPSRFLAPGKPRMPAAPKGKQDHRQLNRIPIPGPSQEPVKTSETAQNTILQGGLGADDKSRLDSLQKALEGLPAALVESVGKMVNESVKASIKEHANITVNQMGGSGVVTDEVIRSESTPMPVILDDIGGTDVQSNIGTSSNATEESSGGLKDKLRKLRETKGT